VFFAKQLMTLSLIGVPGQDNGEVERDSSFWSLMFLMLGLVTFLANAAQSTAFAFASQAFVRRLTRNTLGQLLRQEVSFFDQASNSAGALTAKLSLDTMQASNMSGGNLGNLLISLSIVIGGISLSLALGWKLALVCLSVVPVLVVCSFLRFYVIQQYTGRASRLYVDSAAFAAEHIAAMRTVASLSLESHVASKFKNMAGNQRVDSLKSVSKSAALYAASQSALFLCLGLGFWYGSTLMATFEYGIFQFFVCLMSVIFGSQSAGSMLTFIPDLVKARHAAARLKDLFDTKPSIDTWDEDKGLPLKETQGRLQLRDVHFTYPTRPDRPVLRGLNMVVEPGEHVALVGASGCGKSTIVALIERFYDPSKGQVMLDGVDIADIQVNQYRSHIALVSQEPNLFQGTIRENILFGRRSEDDLISDEAIDQACRDANIYDFIVSLPDGLNTDIGSAGALLSGGQKQRVAIARALLRQPKILLLDEATSALDSEAENVVQASLDRAAKGRTTITIAHRLTTAKHADRILLIDQGRVAESGTHKELLEMNGLYTELMKLQSLDSQQSPDTLPRAL
jgi:ATP-binding cassette, subfamily B (MDR/TAP), member 1